MLADPLPGYNIYLLAQSSHGTGSTQLISIWTLNAFRRILPFSVLAEVQLQCPGLLHATLLAISTRTTSIALLICHSGKGFIFASEAGSMAFSASSRSRNSSFAIQRTRVTLGHLKNQLIWKEDIEGDAVLGLIAPENDGVDDDEFDANSFELVQSELSKWAINFLYNSRLHRQSRCEVQPLQGRRETSVHFLTQPLPWIVVVIGPRKVERIACRASQVSQNTCDPCSPSQETHLARTYHVDGRQVNDCSSQ